MFLSPIAAINKIGWIMDNEIFEGCFHNTLLVLRINFIFKAFNREGNGKLMCVMFAQFEKIIMLTSREFGKDYRGYHWKKRH